MAKVATRSLPTIDRVLRAIGKTSLPRVVVSLAVRRELAFLRSAKKGSPLQGVVAAVRLTLNDHLRTCNEAVINGTGIVVSLKKPGTKEPSRVVRVRPTGSKALLRRRAEKLKLAVEAMPMKTYVGVAKPAGSPVTLEMLPLNITLPEFAARLRKGIPPVIGYVADGRFKLDLRTVDPGQDERLFRAVFKAFGV